MAREPRSDIARKYAKREATNSHYIPKGLQVGTTVGSADPARLTPALGQREGILG